MRMSARERVAIGAMAVAAALLLATACGESSKKADPDGAEAHGGAEAIGGSGESGEPTVLGGAGGAAPLGEAGVAGDAGAASDEPTFQEPDPAHAPAVTPSGFGVPVVGSVTPATSLTLETTAGAYAVKLVIPEYAASRAATVTMTPFSEIDLEGVEIRAGVILQPEGLSFKRSATLTLTPLDEAADLPDPNVPYEVGIAFEAEGAGYHGEPVRIEGNTRRLLIDHFSGYALANFADNGLMNLRQVVSASWEASLNREVLAIVENARAACATDCSTQPPLIEQLYMPHKAFYRKVVRDRVTAPYSTAAALADDLKAFFAWGRQVSLHALEDRFEAEFEEATSALAAKLAACIEEAGVACEADNPITDEAISFYGGLPPGIKSAIANLGDLGRVSPYFDDHTIDVAAAFITQCLEKICGNSQVAAGSKAACESICASNGGASSAKRSGGAKSPLAKASGGVTAEAGAWCTSDVGSAIVSYYEAVDFEACPHTGTSRHRIAYTDTISGMENTYETDDTIERQNEFLLASMIGLHQRADGRMLLSLRSEQDVNLLTQISDEEFVATGFGVSPGSTTCKSYGPTYVLLKLAGKDASGASLVDVTFSRHSRSVWTKDLENAPGWSTHTDYDIEETVPACTLRYAAIVFDYPADLDIISSDICTIPSTNGEESMRTVTSLPP